jgi:hypothetical protein
VLHRAPFFYYGSNHPSDSSVADRLLFCDNKGHIFSGVPYSRPDSRV